MLFLPSRILFTFLLSVPLCSSSLRLLLLRLLLLLLFSFRLWWLLFPPVFLWSLFRVLSYAIRQGPSGPAFRTRAAGALGTTGHTRSQYQNQFHQEGQWNENQV